MALPADLFAATWFFSQGVTGWSETLYRQVGDHNQAMDLAKVYAKLRKQLLATGCQFNGIRVSKVSIPGDSFTERLIGKDAVSSVYTAHPADSPWQCYLLKMWTADRASSRFMYFGGVQDGAVGGQPDFGIRFTDRTFGKNFNDWIGQGNIKRQDGCLATWKWIGKDKNQAFSPILDDPNGVRGVVVVADTLAKLTVPAHGVAVNDYILVNGVVGMNGINGRHLVTDVVGDAVVFRITTKRRPLGDYLGGGRIQKEELIVKDISEVKLDRATHRQRGRPFFSPRGRRSSVA